MTMRALVEPPEPESTTLHAVTFTDTDATAILARTNGGAVAEVLESYSMDRARNAIKAVPPSIRDAALGMALSSLLVTLNALRLAKVRDA